MILYPTLEQERYGAAITLLSLDRVFPFMWLMGPLDVNDWQADGLEFQQRLRQAILVNRKAFVETPDRLPDLRAHVHAALAEPLFSDARDVSSDVARGVTADRLEAWLARDFVHSAADLPDDAWNTVLVLSYRDPDRWARLAIPARRQAAIKEAVPVAFDRKSLHKLTDEMEAIPLSAWDLEMVTLHNLYEEGRDPWDWIGQTITKRRGRALVKLMFEGLSEDERLRLYESAKALSHVIYPGGELGELTDPSFAA